MGDQRAVTIQRGRDAPILHIDKTFGVVWVVDTSFNPDIESQEVVLSRVALNADIESPLRFDSDAFIL